MKVSILLKSILIFVYNEIQNSHQTLIKKLSDYRDLHFDFKTQYLTTVNKTVWF